MAGGGSTTAAEAATPRRRLRLGRRIGRRDVLTALPYLLIFVVGLFAGCVHVARYTEFSPIDELRHVDYAMRAGSGQMPTLR